MVSRRPTPLPLTRAIGRALASSNSILCNILLVIRYYECIHFHCLPASTTLDYAEVRHRSCTDALENRTTAIRCASSEACN